MPSSAFTGALSKKYSVAGNWTGSVPDLTIDASVPVALTCEIDMVAEANTMSVTGTLKVELGGSYSFNHDDKMTINAGGIVAWGQDGDPIPAGQNFVHTMTCNDNIELVEIANTGKWLSCGTATYNMQSEAWGSCWTTLSAQAISGQADISVPTAFANALQASGDVLLLQGTSGTTQNEIVTVLSKSGGTITLTGNLTNTHAAGAVVAILTRNVIVMGTGNANRPNIDDNNTTLGSGMNFKLTEFRDIYAFVAPTTPFSRMNFCTATGKPYRFITTCDYGFILDNFICSGSQNAIFYYCNNVFLTNAILASNANALIGHPVVASGFYWEGGYSFGGTYGVSYFYSGMITNVQFAYHASGDIQPYGDGYLNTCLLGSSTEVIVNSATPGVVYSLNHDQTPGAYVKFGGQIGKAERSNSVVPPGFDYAALFTPNVACSVSTPLSIELGPIPCQHGDTIALSIQARVDATYGVGAGNDPVLVLDPNNIAGCYAASAQVLSAANTWEEKTATGTVSFGGAGIEGTVRAIYKVPYYVASGLAYGGDLTVTITRGTTTLYYTANFSKWGYRGPEIEWTSDVTLDTIYARLGAPAGADMSADIAAVKTVADAIEVKTDSLTFTNAGKVDASIYFVTTNAVTSAADFKATGFSTHNAADVVTALGTGATLTACLTATGFALATVCTEDRLARLDATITSRSSHSAADVVTALGTGITLTACLTATGFALATVCTEDRLARLDVTVSSRSSHSASDVVTALGTGSTLTACLTATGFALATVCTEDRLARLDAAITTRSSHSAADVVTALGTGSTLTACLTATGFSTHSAADVVTAFGTGSTLTACLTATGFALATVCTETRLARLDTTISSREASGAATAAVATLLIPTAAQIADAVLDEALSGHETAGTTGAALGFLLNKWSFTTTTWTVYKSDGSTTFYTFTLAGDGTTTFTRTPD